MNRILTAPELRDEIAITKRDLAQLERQLAMTEGPARHRVLAAIRGGVSDSKGIQFETQLSAAHVYLVIRTLLSEGLIRRDGDRLIIESLDQTAPASLR